MQSYGISKVSKMQGRQEDRYLQRQDPKKRRGSGAGPDADDDSLLLFRLGPLQQQGGAQGAQQQQPPSLVAPPSFNVLYVSTPRIGLLQTPEWRGMASLWAETVALVAPLLRFGLPETSLRTKCPHFDARLYAGASGPMLTNHRTRTLMHGIASGALQPAHSSSSSSSSSAVSHTGAWTEPEQQQPASGERRRRFLFFGRRSSSSLSSKQQQQEQRLLRQQRQQQEAQQAVVDSLPPGQVAVEVAGLHPEFRNLGPFGINSLSFLAQQVLGQAKQQHQQHGRHHHHHQQQQHGGITEQPIPRSRLLVPDIPSGSLVLFLNLTAYWAITKQARRSSMGGTALPP